MTTVASTWSGFLKTMSYYVARVLKSDGFPKGGIELVPMKWGAEVHLNHKPFATVSWYTSSKIDGKLAEVRPTLHYSVIYDPYVADLNEVTGQEQWEFFDRPVPFVDVDEAAQHGHFTF